LDDPFVIANANRIVYLLGPCSVVEEWASRMVIGRNTD
jgi:hypothetical protein